MTDFILPNPGAVRGDQLAAEVLAATGINVAGKYTFYPPDVVRIAADLTAEEIAAIEAAIGAHVPNPDWGVDPQEVSDRPLYAGIQVDLAALETKARAVRAGTDTFTATQTQKILAGLVLRELRRL